MRPSGLAVKKPSGAASTRVKAWWWILELARLASQKNSSVFSSAMAMVARAKPMYVLRYMGFCCRDGSRPDQYWREGRK